MRSLPSGRRPLPGAPEGDGNWPMWLVRIALQRTYTFIVMSMLIVILGVFTITRMPMDMWTPSTPSTP